MNDHTEKLLHCIPQKVLARCRDPVYRFLEKQERSVAVVFVDVEGCTRLCEDLSPSEMNKLIEAYFSRFFDAVEGAGGTVNEIMGDGFMAIFDEDEIRNKTRAAVSAALTIQRQTRDLNAQRPPELDPLLVNIGIHAGIGLVGFTKFRTSSGERWTYTASGPVTNIASRLCALATGGSILVSADVAEHLKEVGYALEPLGPQKLKNVSRPVLTFRLSDNSTDFSESI
ncbi:MAG: adenylate/guanylate cyclase domain-containing protein [Betaproteobacteria bacterium]|nr:adenylate/guanylate cyclase domain-containing protein [Betaproteobacteria bacterium]